jgi:hypothetical protein
MPKAQASFQSMLPPSMILRIMVVYGFRCQTKEIAVDGVLGLASSDRLESEVAALQADD